MWQNEVKQAPQLVQVVLNGRACEQQTLPRTVVLPKRARERALMILQAVALVDDEVLPLWLGERRFVPHHQVVVRDEHGELPRQHDVFSQHPALRARAIVQDALDVWQPALHLVAPVGAHSFGCDDHVRAMNALGLHQIGEKGDGLDGLAQPHFVCEDPAHAIVVQAHHPLKALHLVLAQLAAIEHGGLFVDLLGDGVHGGLVLTNSRELLALGAIGVHTRHRVLVGVTGVARHAALPLDHVPKLQQNLVRLGDQLLELVVLGILDELQVRLIVISLERLDACAFGAALAIQYTRVPLEHAFIAGALHPRRTEAGLLQLALAEENLAQKCVPATNFVLACGGQRLLQRTKLACALRALPCAECEVALRGRKHGSRALLGRRPHDSLAGRA
mmetsp:Transcript_7755/g.31537  ORF Transcript_7755/g.31537 Transcript_7755/m.31537 type:complete len:390 (-) Transcript_7755:465-1634(-)